MNCVLFVKMDPVFSLKNRTLKKYWKMAKNTGKVREFCQSRKVGTLVKRFLIYVSFANASMVLKALSKALCTRDEI